MLRKFYQSPSIHAFTWILIASILNLSFMSIPQVVTLKAGTGIRMATTEALQSENLSVGTMIDLQVIQDVSVEGKVVIPSGSIAKGQVVRVSEAKGLGKAGFVAVELKSVQAVDGTNVMIAGGDIYNEGEDKETEALLLGILLCILFLTIKGKNAYVPAGYEVAPTVAVSTEIEV